MKKYIIVLFSIVLIIACNNKNLAKDYILKADKYYNNKEYTKALEYYLKADLEGNDVASKKLGHLYYYGKGVIKNEKRAIKYYKKSAEKGNGFSQYKLGAIYYDKKKYEKSIKWFEKAIENPNTSKKIKMLSNAIYKEINIERGIKK